MSYGHIQYRQSLTYSEVLQAIYTKTTFLQLLQPNNFLAFSQFSKQLPGFCTVLCSQKLSYSSFQILQNPQ
jgi:hypothetical protein